MDKGKISLNKVCLLFRFMAFA